MIREYLAHSAKGDYPSQSYADHISGVLRRAIQYAREAETYAPQGGTGQLEEIVKHSALLHDLGKLEDANQEALFDASGKQRHLPINHVDAGSAVLKKQNCLYSALMVYSHHRGLPDMVEEYLRGQEEVFRDKRPALREYTDQIFLKLLQRHRNLIPQECGGPETTYTGDLSVFFRMALSCLADADYTDTAIVYGQATLKKRLPQLRAGERLAALDQYVFGLGGEDERSKLRREMYAVCRDAKISSGFTACDSPVGSGKTTAVMAHLLRQAMERRARRIFVILPYTSIIQQSVEVYRKALVLPGENPEDVVAELHCRADFQDKDTRYLTALWRAPVVVTTAVAFFETLASNRPATLRRLHELPGSIIFVDEAHNALPLKLLPLAWQWMNILAEEWGCYWVLASGSLVRYWLLEALRPIGMKHPNVSELVAPALRDQLMQYEHDRVTFRWKDGTVSRDELEKMVQSAPGPRLLILNTVQSAAVIADDLCKAYGRGCVEHLSTALMPEDRDVVIQRVKSRLSDSEDTDWTLVATSCVETGVDFSFQTGFRELSSLLSLLQAAGRVNRHGSIQRAEMWSFSLQEDSMLKKNPTMDGSRKVLEQYFGCGLDVVPELSTCSMNDEIVQDDSCIHVIQTFMNEEKNMQFKTVEDKFHIIVSDTVLAVVDAEFANLIAYGKGDWQMLQKKSVSIRRCRIQSWNLKEIAGGVYQWTLGYDSFLGYMCGVLEIERAKNDILLL